MNDTAPSRGYFEHSRVEILPLLPEKFDAVVDFGGSAGSTLSAIRAQRPEVTTVCIDADQISINRARADGHIAIQCDLNLDVPEICEKCDVALFLDILEHLVDPWRVLKLAVQKLRPGTTVIISLPNIRYWEASINLALCGRWQLQDAGVLDRTHLRFFTRGSGAELLLSSGLVLQQVSGKLPGSRRYALLNLITLGIFSDFLFCQYLYVGVKAGSAP